MKLDDLDKMADSLSDAARKQDSLDTDKLLSGEAARFSSIMDDIENEAARLNPADAGKRKRGARRRPGLEGLRVKMFYFDKRMQEKAWYKPIHYILMGITYPFRKKSVVGGNATAGQLMAMDDRQFAHEVYASILNRKPSPQEAGAVLAELRAGRMSRQQCMWNMQNSAEGRAIGANMAGVKRKYIFWRLSRVIFAIPLLGYIFRVLYTAVRLPRYVNTLTESINTLNDTRDRLQSMMDNLQAEQDKRIRQEQEKQRKSIEEQKLIDRFYDNYNSIIFKDNTRELIKDRYRVYLDKIEQYTTIEDREAACVIDLGSGRGEWLELLIFGGGYTKATGIDSNSVVVANANKLGLNTIHEDAIAYLYGMGDDSADVLTSFHMVEHIDPIDLIHFLDNAYRVLKKGGLLIAETPNPENILVATNTFNLDITHKKPLPPDLLAYMASNAGFEVKEILRKEPLLYTPAEEAEGAIADMAFRFNMEQNYSILAVK